MGENEKKDTQDHLKESRKHLEKGTQKMLEQGIEKGRKQRKKLEYYKQNRSELIQDFSSHIGDSKEPAFAGTIVLLPLLAVALVVSWLFEKIAQMPGNQYFDIAPLLAPLVTPGGFAAYYINQTFKLVILLLFGAFLVTAVGRLVRTTQGFRLEKILDETFDRIPFLGSVYNITKVTTETVLGGAEDLSRPVKINYNGIRMTGFKTGNQTEDGKEIVFMPTAPNITSGLVLELPEEKLEETDESAEEALTRTLSAGFGQSKSKDPDKTEEEDERN